MMLSKRPAETTETDPSEFRFRVIRSYFRLPPEPGGMEEHIARLSEAQRALGVDVVNLFSTGAAEGRALQVLPGRDLLSVRPALLRNMLFYGAACRRHSRLVAPDPTIVHAHGDWSDFLLAKLFARVIGAKAVAASMHGRIPPGRVRLYRHALRGCDPIFTTGKADQLFLQQLLGQPVHHLPSAPNGRFFSAEPAGPPFLHDVISVANFFWEKAPDLVVDCAKLRPQYRFVMFGDGVLREDLLAKVRNEGVTNLELPGRRPVDEVIAHLQRSRVFLSTSLREGTPTAALEAMAVGLPVILTPSNDYRWLVENGQNGFVTSRRDARELVARLDDILSDEGRGRAMGRRNRDRAAQHSWGNNALKVTRLMAERLGTRWSSHCPS
jgi:glycosyltransferase involved in cell wall biosynthesis